ncbi:hypothetical protein PG984_006559 [Apiospora sp. TS-2023a]
MDPASAVGVAAAAAQFLGIALKAIRLCYQIRDNADSATDRNKELEEFALELKGSNAKLTSPTAGWVPHRITDVAKKCDRLTKDVLDLCKMKIEKLERSLKEEEQTLESLLVKDIWSVTHTNSATNITQFKSLDAKIECLIRSLSKAKHLEIERATKISEGIVSARAVIETKLDQTAVDVAQQIAQADTNGLERHRVTERSAKARHQSTIQKTREGEFLGSLFFNEMDDRQIHIRDAAPGTLEWIFYDANTDETSPADSSSGKAPYPDTKWDNFYKWLCIENSPYWICGKLGSGKSTLMSHIVQDWRTRKGLDIWKGQDRLSTGITKAFEVGDYLRICIFLDGLDEFLGDYNELLDLVLKLQMYSHVKMCVSSRPENQIIHRLSRCHQLHLEDLNYNDIHGFVTQKLEQAGLRLPHIEHESAASYIVQKAEGVFLYAALVTQALVQGAHDGDDEDILLKRITSIPQGIREVFKFLIGNIDDLQKQSLAFYLSIMKLLRAMEESSKLQKLLPGYKTVTVASITFARLGLQIFGTRLGEMPKLCSRTETQIRCYSAGLLDVVNASGVDDKMNRDEWRDPCTKRWLSSGEFISDDDWTRRQFFGEAPPYPRLLYYESRTIDWVHRSAYDFIFDSAIVREFGFSVPPIEVALQKMLAGSILNFALAPSVSSDDKSARITSLRRLWATITALATCWSLSPTTVANATNSLYRICLQLNPDEFACIGIPKEVVLDFRFWRGVLSHNMFEYALDRIQEIPRQCLAPILGSPAFIINFESALCRKGFTSVLGSLRRSVGSVQMCRRASKREVKNTHGSNATETEVFNASGFASTLINLERQSSDISSWLAAVKHICAISDSTGFFVGMANSGGRLYLQIAGSLFVDPQGPIYDGFRKATPLNLQASEPLLRLICIPSRYHSYPEKFITFDQDFAYYEEIKSFIRIDLRQSTARVLLSYLRNDLVNPESLLRLPAKYDFEEWPLIFATEKELRDLYQLILDDARLTEQLQDSTEKLLALACLRVHLWDLLYSIWVRLLEDEDTDVDSSPGYSGSERSQEDEEAAEDDESEWWTDEEDMPLEEQLGEDSDSDWWTDDEEISETRRWLRSRDRMTIVQRNGEHLPKETTDIKLPKVDPTTERRRGSLPQPGELSRDEGLCETTDDKTSKAVFTWCQRLPRLHSQLDGDANHVG